MPRKLRVRPVHPALQGWPPRGIDQSKYVRPELPSRLSHSQKWLWFNPQRHREALLLDADFLQSLDDRTRLLEIGFGTGRFADYLLRHTRLQPENYELLGQETFEEGPFLKRRVYDLVLKKKILLTRANMWTHVYPRNQYNHVIVPEAYFPEWKNDLGEPLPPGAFSRLPQEEKRRLKSEHLAAFVKRLSPSVRKGGSIRISYFSGDLTPEAQKKLSRYFRIRQTWAGIIFDKK